MGAPINTAFLRPSYFPSTSQALPFPVPAPTPYPPVRPLGTRISDWRQHSMEHSSVLMTRICLKKGSNLSSLVEQRSPPQFLPIRLPTVPTKKNPGFLQGILGHQVWPPGSSVALSFCIPGMFPQGPRYVPDWDGSILSTQCLSGCSGNTHFTNGYN